MGILLLALPFVLVLIEGCQGQSFQFGQKNQGTHNVISPGSTPMFSKDEMFNDIFLLSKANFTEKVLNSKESWVVIFHDGHLSKTWKTLASSMRGVIWMGMVHIDQEKELMKMLTFPNDTVPEAMLYPYGGKVVKKSHAAVITTASQARSKAIKSLPDKTVPMKGHSLQDLLVECFVAAPSKFPAILVTDAAKTPSVFKAIALRFERYLHMGVLFNPEPEELAEVGLADIGTNWPLFAILLVKADADGMAGKTPVKVEAILYDRTKYGDITYPNLLRFLFAVNSQYRHTLLGDNMSNKQTEAELLDILEIEKERFDISFPEEEKMKAERKEKEKKEKRKARAKKFGKKNLADMELPHDPYLRAKDEL